MTYILFVLVNATYHFYFASLHPFELGYLTAATTGRRGGVME